MNLSVIFTQLGYGKKINEFKRNWKWELKHKCQKINTNLPSVFRSCAIAAGLSFWVWDLYHTDLERRDAENTAKQKMAQSMTETTNSNYDCTPVYMPAPE